MEQVYKSGAVASAPSSAGAQSQGNPTEGDTANGTPATVIGDYWFYGWSKEGEAIIRAGRDSNGDPMVPDKDTLTQMRDAIQSMIDRAAPKGGVTGGVDAENVAFAITADDNGKTFKVDASGAARTATLPDLGADDDGFTVTVMKADSSANHVTVDGNGADTINGATSAVFSRQWEATVLKWNGNEWLIIASSARSPESVYIAAIGDAGVALTGDAVGTAIALSRSYMDFKFLGLSIGGYDNSGPGESFNYALISTARIRTTRGDGNNQRGWFGAFGGTGGYIWAPNSTELRIQRRSNTLQSAIVYGVWGIPG